MSFVESLFRQSTKTQKLLFEVKLLHSTHLIADPVEKKTILPVALIKL